MDQAAIMNTLQRLIDDSKTGVLATTDSSGLPRLRWMTPTILNGRPNALFCVTYPGSHKISDLQEHPQVRWMIQSRALAEIITLKGSVNIVDNPAIKSEVLEALGHRLTVFWNVNIDKTELVVLETIIEEAVYFKPMKSFEETVTFEGA
jgi:general stress protein 26